MNKVKESKTVKQGSVSLSVVWGWRLQLHAEGDKLCAEGNKLWAEGNKLCAEGNKLCAEGNKLWAEGNKLCAEGDKLWAEGIIAAYGNVAIRWTWRQAKNDSACEVEGQIFEP